MSTLVTLLHVIVCLFLMLTVLLQSGKGGGMGAAFGGGNAATVFGSSGASGFLKRLTAIAGTIFMATSMVLAFLASLGPGLWLTAMNVKYRDFRYVLPFVVQLGLYVSPVGFSSSLIPDDWRLVYSLNPMVGVIDGFRWAVLGDQARIYLPGFAVSCSVIVILLFLGLRKFRAMERAFADLI